MGVNMRFLALFGLLAVASSKNVISKINELEYGFCSGSPEPMSIDDFTVTPFPVVLAEGESVTIHVQLTLNEPIPAGSKVKLNFKKDGFIDIPVPCIEIDGTMIGSCEYDGDELLAGLAPVLCPAYVPEGQECALPLGPGMYGGGEPITIVFPAIPPELGLILGKSATLYADATITGPDGKIACVYLRVQVE